MVAGTTLHRPRS
jgi:hypothetical protein